MQTVKRIAAALLAGLLTLALLAGCAGEETPEEEQFALRVCVGGAVETLDPAMSTEAGARSILCAVYENLMRMSDDGTGRASPAPGVAKEYRMTANYDGTVDYTFTLRSTARWSDGKRVRARDFVYAWRRLVDPATGSPNHAVLSMVKGYDAVRETGDVSALAVYAENDTTLRVTLSAPSANFLESVCTSAATMPLRSDAVEKEPGDHGRGGAAVSNGPYRLSLWMTDNYIQLRRNTSYYGSRLVGPDTIRFVFASGAEEAYRLYASGEVDYVFEPPAYMLTAPEEAEEAADAIPLRETLCVVYNHMGELFADAHVRRAFDLTLNRVAIASAADALPAAALVPYGLSNNADGTEDFRTAGGVLCPLDEEGYPERAAQARQELLLAGYGGVGALPELTCVYAEENGFPLAIRAAQSMWHDVLGAEVSFVPLSREELAERVAAGEYDLLLERFDFTDGEVMPRLAAFDGAEGDNRYHYANGTYDILLGVARWSNDLAARTAFLHDAEALLIEDAALSPVTFGAVTYLLRDGLRGVYHDTCGGAYFSAVAKVEAAE